jgi:hypothetical protein
MIVQQTRRKHGRQSTVRTATLEAGGQTIQCLVRDVSDGGARLKLLEGEIDEGASGSLVIPRVGAFAGQVVWCSGRELGMRFGDELPPDMADTLGPSDIADVLGLVAWDKDGQGAGGS